MVTLRGAKQDVEKCAAHLKKLALDLVRERGKERGMAGRRGGGGGG